MDNKSDNKITYPIPKLATGTILPNSIYLKILEEEKKKAEKKAQVRHDWIIATYGIVGGGIVAFIIWLLTK